MTKTRAERKIGCEVQRLQEGNTDARLVYGASRGDELIAEAAHLTDDLALQILVHQVYAIHSLEALQQHGWRCARGCRFITANTGPMEVLIDLRIWSRCVGTATS